MATTHTLGINDMLDAWDDTTTLYVGLIRDDSYVDLGTAADTMASHGNWEEADEYSGSRKEFVAVAAAGGALTNSASKASFAVNGTETFKGFFLCTAATGTTCILVGAALFTSGDQACVNGQTLEVEATITVS